MSISLFFSLSCELAYSHLYIQMDEVFIFITHFEIGMSEQKFKSQYALYKNLQT